MTLQYAELLSLAYPTFFFHSSAGDNDKLTFLELSLKQIMGYENVKCHVMKFPFGVSRKHNF